MAGKERFEAAHDPVAGPLALSYDTFLIEWDDLELSPSAASSGAAAANRLS